MRLRNRRAAAPARRVDIRGVKGAVPSGSGQIALDFDCVAYHGMATRSDQAEEILHALAKPRREIFTRLASIGKFFHAGLSEGLSSRQDLAELGGDRGPFLEYRREVDLGDFVDRRSCQRPDREHGRSAGQQPGLSEAIARGKAHRFRFSRPVALNGDKDAGAQDEKSLSDGALLDQNIAGLVSPPLHLRGKMDALLL